MTKYYAVKNTSGVNQFRACILGTGKSANEAIKDAYGDTVAHGKRQMKCSGAWVMEITEDEYLDQLYGAC